METTDSTGRGLPFASVLYAEPGVLGLIANIISALVAAVSNIIGIIPPGPALFLTGAHHIIGGGFLQIVAGILSFRRWDHLTASTFLIFGSLWTIFGINQIIFAFVPQQTFPLGILPGMLGFMGVTVILCICSITLNFILPPVLVAILLTLIFEAVGLFFLWGRRVAAAFELLIVIASLYAIVVMLLKGVSQRYILPGFGNAPYDPLLIRTRSQSRRTKEVKKITKWSEPMGLGYMGNVVPATVITFTYLGYVQDFQTAAPMFLYAVVCHCCASWYSFVRFDFFHATQFIIYLMFWLSKGLGTLFVIENFPNDLNLRQNFYGTWGMVLIFIFLMVMSLTQGAVCFIYNTLFTIMIILSVTHIPPFAHNFTLGIPAAVFALFSLYMSMAYLENSVAEKPVILIGPEIIPLERMQVLLNKLRRGKIKFRDQDEQVEEDVVDALAFIANAVCCICISSAEITNTTQPLGWILTVGVFINLYTCRLAFAAGSLGRAYGLLVFAMLWASWATWLFNPLFAAALQGITPAIVVLLLIFLFITPAYQKIWIPFSLGMLIISICLVARVFNADRPFLTLVLALIVGLISLYGAFAFMINGTLQGPAIPVGEPFIKQKGDSGEMKPPCPLFPSRRARAMREVAQILDQGGVVGVPTDTVYALAGSLKHPEVVKKIYNIKERPLEKPICICLSNLDQLAESNPPFSDLMWAFFRRCYPGGISCVVAKGDWMVNLGIGDAMGYIGKGGTVCIRVPDSSVLAYIVSLTGPVAITSANPSGGEDSTHHDMVIASLGHKIDGCVCDGVSNELSASTVVNCLEVDKGGEITYFRIGCTPQDIVDRHWADAKAEVATKPIPINLDSSMILGPKKVS